MHDLDDMGKRSDPKVAVSFRLSPAGAKRIRRFLADYAGKPLFLKPSSFAEAALLREADRLELILSGALPADRTTGHTDEEPPVQRRPVNAHSP